MGTIRTRKRGKTWSYSFDVGKSPDTGRRKIKEKGGFPTQEAAYEAGVTAYAEWKHGNIGITSSRVSLDTFFDSWLHHVIAGTVKPGTVEHYERQYRCYIRPYLGTMMLQKIRPRDVDRMAHAILGKGLSFSTITNALSILHGALKYAVYPSELISSNPAECIKTPRNAPKHITKRIIISKEQFAGLMETFPIGHRYRIPCLLGYYTGLRLGEILGLGWNDISFENKTITVRCQIHETENNTNPCFSTPKTPSSIRTIAIGNTLLGELKRWRQLQCEYRVQLGPSFQQVYEDLSTHNLIQQPAKDPAPSNSRLHHMVCTNSFGNIISRKGFQKKLRRLGINSHSFRHTHATKLIEAGAKAVDVAARLGHSDVSTTENIYAHDTEAMQRETAALVEEIM